MPIRILVIEDNPANMELMAYLLKAFGYELLAATDGESGLAAAASGKPDLIICDVHLPQLDGYGVVRVLKGTPALRDIPAIAVTALAMVGDRDKLLAAGFDGYISKPIDPETFVAELGRFLPAAERSNLESNVKATLLVVCDDDIRRKHLAQQLDGYGTAWVDSLEDARSLAHIQAFDLALIDLRLPNDDYLQRIADAKSDAALERLPFILFGTPESIGKAQGRGTEIARFLPRTVEPRVLTNEIETCLQHENRRKDGDHTDR